VLQAAVALETARFHKRNLAFARVEQDLEAARGIQRSLLPQQLPAIPGYRVGFRSDACYEVGGDYFDAIALHDGSVLFAVADVAGKGLASALMSSSFRSAFRAMATTGAPLDELAGRMNQHHWSEGEEARRRYVTAIFLHLLPEKSELEIVNAGHNPGFLVAPGAAPRQFAASGPPLGMLPGMSYTIERCPVPIGARLLSYTDGLTEVFRGEDEFGPDRLLHAFSQCPTAEPDAMLKAVWTAVEEFAAGGPQQDDRTALVLCRATAPGSPA
jgi:sigma-B regulation protein RsbU (phosphoserine phosphatase)